MAQPDYYFGDGVLYAGPLRLLSHPLVVLIVFFAFLASVWHPVALAGYVVWTFTEYAIHRWLFHQYHRPWLKKIWEAAHRAHHRQRAMNDPQHHALSLLCSVPTAAAVFCVFWIALPLRLAIPCTAGFGAGYAFYELLHWCMHTDALSRRLMRVSWYALHHRLHAAHHRRMRMNFGFSIYVWDRLLGTYDA